MSGFSSAQWAHAGQESSHPFRGICILLTCTRLSERDGYPQLSVRLIESEKPKDLAARGHPNRHTRIPPRYRSQESLESFQQGCLQSGCVAGPARDCGGLLSRSLLGVCSAVCINGVRCSLAHQSSPISSRRSQASPQWKQQFRTTLKGP